MVKDQVMKRPVSNYERLKEARWVTDMRDHHARTGHYRPQDVDRILGDPRDRAEVPVNLEHRTGSKLLAD
jgi:hypothetical protein